MTLKLVTAACAAWLRSAGCWRQAGSGAESFPRMPDPRYHAGMVENPHESPVRARDSPGLADSALTDSGYSTTKRSAGLTDPFICSSTSVYDRARDSKPLPGSACTRLWARNE